MKPLADRIRPQTIDEVYGQKHLLGEGKVLRNIIESKNVPNMIFYGPSGTGKTTVASIIAENTNKKLYKLNATNASVADIKDIIGDLGGFDTQNGVLLYLDEIQNFNKKQQQSLLQFIEDGSITLIASTTENPYFYVFNAILSRSIVFEFRPLDETEIREALVRAEVLLKEDFPKLSFQEEALDFIAATSNGDVRSALNVLELLAMSFGEKKIQVEDVENAIFRKSLKYDKFGDNHYDILSAFQKSIRGSDVDASLHYLARLLESGDIKSPIRRLLVIASEDVGMAYPQAASIVKACVDSALMLGLPEARLPLAQAVILLATAPKSNSGILAIDAAIADISGRDCGEVPNHLKDAHYSGAKEMDRGTAYQYAHNFPNNYVKQQYLPDKIKNAVYYEPQGNKFESSLKKYWDEVKKNK